MVGNFNLMKALKLKRSAQRSPAAQKPVPSYSAPGSGLPNPTTQKRTTPGPESPVSKKQRQEEGSSADAAGTDPSPNPLLSQEEGTRVPPPSVRVATSPCLSPGARIEHIVTEAGPEASFWDANLRADHIRIRESLPKPYDETLMDSAGVVHSLESIEVMAARMMSLARYGRKWAKQRAESAAREQSFEAKIASLEAELAQQRAAREEAEKKGAEAVEQLRLKQAEFTGLEEKLMAVGHRATQAEEKVAQVVEKATQAEEKAARAEERVGLVEKELAEVKAVVEEQKADLASVSAAAVNAFEHGFDGAVRQACYLAPSLDATTFDPIMDVVDGKWVERDK